MGAVDSVPATLHLTTVRVVDGRASLSFESRRNHQPENGAGGEGQDRTDGTDGPESRSPWVDVESLELQSVEPVPVTVTVDGQELCRLKNRRLAFKGATLVTSTALLQEALASCPLMTAGISELRPWMGPDGVRLVGRVAIQGVEAPFTVRVAVEPRSEGRRRLLVGLSDVRLFGALPLPAPLVGATLGRAILARQTAIPGTVRAIGPTIDVDALEASLATALVAKGWRLPDLGRGWLKEVVQGGDGDGGGGGGEIRLRFASDGHPTERLGTLEEDPRADGVDWLAWLEGERLPDSLGRAEKLMFDGDWSAAEEAYREALADAAAAGAPDPWPERAARARLLTLKAAATGSETATEVAGLAGSLLAKWPDCIPAILHAAIAASQMGEGSRAAELFEQAAALAATRGEYEDAALARTAANHARASLGSIGAVTAESAVPDPNDSSGGARNVTSRTAAIYAAQGEPDGRADALAALMHDFALLPPDRQHDAYASFGRVSEATGDLEYAEEAYWRAASVAPDPTGRANDLVAHARVLLARGNRAAAVAELEEALVLAARHPAAMALLAEESFQLGDWQRARHLYALLAEGEPPTSQQTATEDGSNSGPPIARATVLLRRAWLARQAGDREEAEDCYAELAALDATHIEARHGLAELALERHDLRAAADRLEEVLRLLPREAFQSLLDTRQQLADIYAGLGDWAAARRYAELVLAQDPRRTTMLERLTEIYQQLGLWSAAAEALVRLARLHGGARAGAESLLRAGELWQDRLNDEARAFDAYLKASDLDPSHAPTALRLMAGYWARGQFSDVAEVAVDLRRAGPLPDLDAPLRLRLAVALAMTGEDASSAVDQSDLARTPWNAEVAAAVFVETAAHLAARPPADLAPAVAVLETWRGMTARDEPGQQSDDDGQRTAGGTLHELWNILNQPRPDDSAATLDGLAPALAWVAQRQKGSDASGPTASPERSGGVAPAHGGDADA